MTDEEQHLAISALTGWFESQEIAQLDAIMIMAKMISLMLEFYSKNTDAESDMRLAISDYIRDPLTFGE